MKDKVVTKAKPKKAKPKLKIDKREFISMSKDEFMAEGKRLFGDDEFKWKFQCPLCGNIQTPEDFRKHKDVGATVNSAYKECIGRYQDNPYCAFGENKPGHKKSPCDYAVYGLFKIGNIVKLATGKEIVVFPFANKTKKE